MTHANVIKVVNAFATSRLNREEVSKKLSELSKGCSKKCEECPLPEVVKTNFKEAVVTFLRIKLACLRPSQ